MEECEQEDKRVFKREIRGGREGQRSSFFSLLQRYSLTFSLFLCLNVGDRETTTLLPFLAFLLKNMPPTNLRPTLCPGNKTPT